MPYHTNDNKLISACCVIFDDIGAGYAIVIINLICTVYYNIIIAYPVVFIAKSFAKTLPWMHCNNEWNTPYCLEVRLWIYIKSDLCLTNDFESIDATPKSFN